jgi:hypothetical protein
MKRKRIDLVVYTLVIATFFLPQVLAMTPIQFNPTAQKSNEQPHNSEVFTQPIWFVKPVLKKLYLGDNTEISLRGNRSIIIGPITLQVSTETQNGLISVKYHFTDMNNTALGPDVVINWNSSYPNYDYFYAKRHFPIPTQNLLPSKFKIEAIAQILGIPYASVNITVFKIF